MSRAYEQPGAFYLGRAWNEAADTTSDELVLYDAKDLTTHAVCVGMTGSGKTGLCLALLEEAAIDAVPAIAIDPKGDIGNLLLTFPELRPDDFRPWIDETEASRQGLSPEQYAERTAKAWREGLAAWDQDGERIARLRSSADISVYTPGSTSGIPLGVLRRLEPPPAALIAEDDALRERVLGTVSGLLSLLGLDADPLRGREHILISRLLEEAWRADRGLEIGDLIHAIQKPPFDRVGVLDLESFFPAAQRFSLAMTLNNLVASPGFAPWLQGEPLDVARLLWTERGTPRISILSIAHLSDAERMFFVTLLLNEVVAWMRTQPGSGSLRAILYMDEVFGFLPPTANPPSKTPMLTLLKQARAFGLGVVLATQNPVDLDYKALSNAGTWFLGRLQTERDRMRMLDGLEGIGAGFDRARIDRMLSGLRSRVFYMHNVHEREPIVFQTRWVMSYLRGPLTRAEIARLTEARAEADIAPVTRDATTGEPAHKVDAGGVIRQETGARPVLPAAVPERFVADAAADVVHYHAALVGRGRVHFVDAKLGVDRWEDVTLRAPLGAHGVARDPWSEADVIDERTLHLAERPVEGARFAELPAEATRAENYVRWQKLLADHLYRLHRLTVWRAEPVGVWSEPDESEAAFRIRVTQLARERRDEEVEKLRQRYAPKLQRLSDQLRRADERIAREQSQLQQQKYQTAISVGTTLVGALLGRKLTSASGVGRAASSMRGVGRIGREKEDVERAAESREVLQQRLAELEADVEREAATLRDSFAPAAVSIQPREITPRKADIAAERVLLVWFG